MDQKNPKQSFTNQFPRTLVSRLGQPRFDDGLRDNIISGVINNVLDQELDKDRPSGSDPMPTSKVRYAAVRAALMAMKADRALCLYERDHLLDYLDTQDMGEDVSGSE